jgi:hydrogenase expression/formation protein HypD
MLDDIKIIAERMPSRTIRLMEVCGTHTFAIMRSGIPGMLPENVRLVSGPGCPVCVTPPMLIDAVVEIARQEDAVLATFGDMMRVPGGRDSLESARAEGADIRVLYSPTELIPLALELPKKRIVFLSVGFETTAPAVSWTVIRAAELDLKNLSIIPANKLIPPALDALANDGDIDLQGFICPGHVSIITGAVGFEPVVKRYRIPSVVAGFEPLDVLLAIRMLLLQLVEGRAEIEIEYTRAVSWLGNERARISMAEVFEPVDSAWRGLGIIHGSGLGLRPKYEYMDALKQTGITIPSDASMPSDCACGEVLKGTKVPEECALFRTRCTPENPVGPCIVSSEGTCAAHYKYGLN